MISTKMTQRADFGTNMCQYENVKVFDVLPTILFVLPELFQISPACRLPGRLG